MIEQPTYDVFLHTESNQGWYWLAFYHVYRESPEAAIDQILQGFTARNSSNDFVIREACAYPSSECVRIPLEQTPAPIYRRVEQP